MFLHKSKRPDGRIYLALMKKESVNGVYKNRTVKSLGYLCDLEKEYPDPINHFKMHCEAQNKKDRQNNQAVNIKIFPNQQISKKNPPMRKNLGSSVLLKIYNSLNIERTIRNATAGKKFDFDLSAVLRLLTCDRILNPSSKLNAFENKDTYFFRTDFELHDTYRALDYLCDIKHKIISAMNRSIAAQGLRGTGSVFYDVTNYYFEIDDTDDLRKFGCSKEHRKSPIVQMGLLQDKNGIPITYKLFPGNVNDCMTLLEVLPDMKKDFKVDRVIVVADKGNNCSTNIAACVGKGDGFVYSQSIRGTKSNKDLRSWVLNNSGYAVNSDGSFKIKSKQDYKEITITNIHGKKVKHKIPVKVVAFWSKKYQQRARSEREKTLLKAESLINNPSSYTANSNFGAAKYVKGFKIDADTGEVLGGKQVLKFDDERLTQDEMCDGYYCIITSETKMPDQEIIDTYKQLWRIEESFKVTKSDLQARPVYLSKPKHIEAHFLSCYISLCILRLLQLKTDYKYSARQIADDLKKMNGTNIDENWWMFNHRTDIGDNLANSVGLDLRKRNMQLIEIKKIFSK